METPMGSLINAGVSLHGYTVDSLMERFEQDGRSFKWASHWRQLCTYAPDPNTHGKQNQASVYTA